jgi:hypothetical protein
MISVISKIKNFFNKESLKNDNEFIWKYMDIDQSLVDEIKDIYLKNIKKDLTHYGFFQIIDATIPNIMGQKVVIPALIYCPRNYVPQYSHKDKDLTGNNVTYSTFALNIPLINCENSRTIFYECKKTEKFFYKERLIEVKDISNCKEIGSYVLDKPILFNTQVLHAVFNHSDMPRLAISLRFEKNPVEWI